MALTEADPLDRPKDSMKRLVPLVCAVMLTACSVAPAPSTSNPEYPVDVTHLEMSVDGATSQVDVHLTVKSRFERTLKTLRVFVAIYDKAGTQIGSDQTIEILGPINNGQSIGPLDKITSVRDSGAKCVSVTRVEAVMMDYATRVASGAQAIELVTDHSHENCGASVGQSPE